MTDTTAFEFSDVQGIVRFGHGGLRAAVFLLLGVRDPEGARRLLAGLPVTTAEARDPRPERALQVAFTADGLRRLGVAEEVIEGFSDEFLGGMTDASRSRRLGDVAANAPEHWLWGGDEPSRPDVLLMCYATPEGLPGWLEQLRDGAFDAAFTVLAELPCSERVEQEPFGFADGISQPAIDWKRAQTADLHRRDRYSNLLSLGEVLLGYPNEYGEYTQRPLLRAADHALAKQLPAAEDERDRHDLGRNGSYLALRQLEQDVAGFWRALDRAAGSDAEGREALASAMVGRRRDGTPMVAVREAPIEGVEENARDRNNFDFEDDPRGVQCPLASHLRRCNPRTGDFPPGAMGPLSRMLRILGFDKDARTQDLVASTRFHRILRRGRPYGPGIGPEQAMAGKGTPEAAGLHFACLSANLARQFEFVQNAWIVNSKFAGLQDEEDPLLGNREPLAGGTTTGSFGRPSAGGPRQCLHALPSFVTVRGGAYFFLPGLRALEFICSGPVAGEGEG